MKTSRHRDIRRTIEDRIDIMEVSQTQLAKVAEVSEPTISRFMNYENELGFAGLVRIAAYLFPDNHAEVLAKWSLELETPFNHRACLEYASVTGNTALLLTLIEMNIGGDYGRPNKHLAIVYREFLRYTLREIDADELTKRIKCVGTASEAETAALIKLIEVYAIFRAGKYALTFEYGKTLEAEISGLKSGFMRDSLMIRLAEVYSYGYLYAKGDVKKARYYSGIVKQAVWAPRLAAQAFYVSGMSYLHEDEGRTLSDLQACYDGAKSAGASERFLRGMRENIDFARIHFDLPCEPTTPTEIAYQAAKKGDVETAERYASQSTNKPMSTFCVALARKDVDLMWQAYGEFIAAGDLHFAVLPRKELERYGERESAINCYLRMA